MNINTMTSARLIYITAIIAALIISLTTPDIPNSKETKTHAAATIAESTNPNAGYNVTYMENTLAELLNRDHITIHCIPNNNAPESKNGMGAAGWVYHENPNHIYFRETLCSEIETLTTDINNNPESVRPWVIINTITREAVHTLGIRDEQLTECIAIQTNPRLSEALGINPTIATHGQDLYYARYNFVAYDGYWSNKCVAGGEYDLNLGTFPNTIELPHNRPSA